MSRTRQSDYCDSFVCIEHPTGFLSWKSVRQLHAQNVETICASSWCTKAWHKTDLLNHMGRHFLLSGFNAALTWAK